MTTRGQCTTTRQAIGWCGGVGDSSGTGAVDGEQQPVDPRRGYGEPGPFPARGIGQTRRVGEQCYGCHVAEDDHLGSRVESWLAFWTMDEACVAHVGSAAVCRLLMSSIVQVVGVWTWGAAQESRRCASGGSTMKQERSMAGGR